MQTPPISSPSSSIVAHVPIPVMTKPTVYINLNNMFDPSEYVKFLKKKYYFLIFSLEQKKTQIYLKMLKRLLLKNVVNLEKLRKFIWMNILLMD